MIDRIRSTSTLAALYFATAIACTPSRPDGTQRQMAMVGADANLTKTLEDTGEIPSIASMRDDDADRIEILDTINKAEGKGTDIEASVTLENPTSALSGNHQDQRTTDSRDSLSDLDDPSDVMSVVEGIFDGGEVVSNLEAPEQNTAEAPNGTTVDSETTAVDAAIDEAQEADSVSDLPVSPDLGGDRDNTQDSVDEVGIPPSTVQEDTIDGSGPEASATEPPNSKHQKIASDGHILFVTSKRFSGNLAEQYGNQTFLTGLEGADFRCNVAAYHANLPGQYRALIADGNWSLGERIKVTEKVYNSRGQVVVASAEELLTRPNRVNTELLQNRVRYDEYGNEGKSVGVWTGLNSEMDAATWRNCQDWTTAASKERGKYGRSNKKDYRWFSQSKSSAPCHRHLSLYCISQ